MRKEIVTTVCDNKNNNKLYLPYTSTHYSASLHNTVSLEISGPETKKLQLIYNYEKKVTMYNKERKELERN